MTDLALFDEYVENELWRLSLMMLILEILPQEIYIPQLLAQTQRDAIYVHS
jgi:hypothetical protein